MCSPDYQLNDYVATHALWHMMYVMDIYLQIYIYIYIIYTSYNIYWVVFDKDNIWLYRDDGLSAFKNHNSKVWKERIYLFQQHHLNLEIKCNLKIVDYLDITFDLITGLFKLYKKTNNIPRYVNAKSNHPPSIMKEIPKSVSKRIIMNRFLILVHRFITTFQINVDALKNSHLRKNSTYTKEEIEGETPSGTKHHLVKIFKPILRNNFYIYWINILVKIINITRSSTVAMSKLVIAAWIISQT